MTTTMPTADRSPSRAPRAQWITLATGAVAVCLSLIALAELPTLPVDDGMPVHAAAGTDRILGTTVPSADRLEAVASFEASAPTF